MPVGAPGAYQRRNFALAIAAAEAFLGTLSREAVTAAAADVRVPGRMQQIDSDPLTLIDGAHNADGMRALAESLPEITAGHHPVIAVVSILDDKDAAGMLAELRAESVGIDGMVFTSSQNPRALPPPTLQSLGRQLHGPPAEIIHDPFRAVAHARRLAGPAGVVIATGSLYLIADLLAGGPREHTSVL
jgi:dihydrofolate synthase/folylpolyglutamate synthase